LGETPARRRVAVLGAMKELGAGGDGYHAALAGPLVDAGVTRALLVGAEMAPLADALGKIDHSALAAPIAFVHVPGAAQAAEILASGDWAPQGGDAILIKGSNSVGLSVLVKALAQRAEEPRKGPRVVGNMAAGDD